MPDLRRVRGGAAVGLLAVVVTACGYSPTQGKAGASPSKSTGTGCASTGPVSLPYSSRGMERAALFTSDGSELVFTADGFAHGGVLDPKVGKTAVYVGRPPRMPVFNEATSELTNVTHEFRITEGQETSQTLPAGRYWLATSNFVHIKVWSCPPGGVTLLPPGRSRASSTPQAPGTAPHPRTAIGGSTVNGSPLGYAPVNVSVGDELRLVVESFRAGSSVQLRLYPIRTDLGTVTVGANGLVQTTVTVPDVNPGVHQLSLVGEGASGVQSKFVPIRVPGRPSGDTYATYLCCFEPLPETVTAETVTETISVTVDGQKRANFLTDPDGGFHIRIPIANRLSNAAPIVIEGTSSVTGRTLRELVNPIPKAP